MARLGAMSATFRRQERGLMAYPRSGWRKLMFRWPIVLWRLGLAPLIGRSFLLLTTTGRAEPTSSPRRTASTGSASTPTDEPTPLASDPASSVAGATYHSARQPAPTLTIHRCERGGRAGLIGVGFSVGARFIAPSPSSFRRKPESIRLILAS